MSFMVYKCVFGFGLEGNFDENGSKLAISVMFDTPTPRRRSPRLGVAKLCLGVPVSFVLVALFR